MTCWPTSLPGHSQTGRATKTMSKPDIKNINGTSDPIVRASLLSTAAFGALSLATYLLDGSLDRTFSVVCAVLFVAGTLLLGLGMWNGIQRSRIEEVTLTGLLSVDKSHVPGSIRNALWLSIVLQVALSLLFASLRPFTEQAFGLLVPMVGLGFAGLWGSRFAEFHARSD